MTFRHVAAAGLACAALAACSGQDHTPYAFADNTAAGASFVYGSGSALDAGTLATVDGQVEATPALAGGSPQDLTTAQLPSSSIIPLLLGDAPAPTAAAPALAGAPGALALPGTAARAVALPATALAASPGFNDPGCLTQTATSAVFKGCVATSTSDGVSATLYVDGSVDALPAVNGLRWDLTVEVDLSGNGAAVVAAQHSAGDFASSASTFTGTFQDQVAAHGSGQGGAVALAYDESLSVDVTYQTTPTACVTGGTLEAKRVWVLRPDLAGADLSDKAASVTWTGCGEATVQYSSTRG